MICHTSQLCGCIVSCNCALFSFCFALKTFIITVSHNYYTRVRWAVVSVLQLKVQLNVYCNVQLLVAPAGKCLQAAFPLQLPHETYTKTQLFRLFCITRYNSAFYTDITMLSRLVDPARLQQWYSLFREILMGMMIPLRCAPIPPCGRDQYIWNNSDYSRDACDTASHTVQRRHVNTATAGDKM